MIHLRKLSLRRGTKVLLDKADLNLFAGQKVGIVGANGIGKSSLFQCLLGHLNPDDGDLDIPAACRIAHLQQELPDSELSATDYALLGDPSYASLKVEVDEADASNDGMRIAHAHTKFAEIDGYAAPSRAAKILLGLGFDQAQLHSPVNSFSGGWQMRLNLAQVLLSGADIMLLDEPTNHLDLEGIVWLSDWLKRIDSMVLLISHDRDFLDDVANYIVQFLDHKTHQFTGNYSSFEREFAQKLAMQQASFTKQQMQRAHLQKFIDRFGAKATKAKQAQSRAKMLERMELVAPVHQANPFNFSFFDNQCGVNPMITMDNVTVGYDKTPVLNDITISIRDDDRIGLLGFNGAGKSTFIKLLSNQIEAISGKINRNNKIKVGYFAQHQLDLLDPNANMIVQLRRIDPSVTDGQARTFFGGFNFSGDRVFQNIGIFSGGEKARLVIALLVWQKPNLLLLDEPTNHLDMEMREALMQALLNFNGALILVSHDRYLLKCLVNEYWLIDDGKAKVFDGDLDDYHQWLSLREENSKPEKKIKTKVGKKENIDKKIEQLEKKLNTLREKLSIIEKDLCDNDLYSQENKDKLENLQQQQKSLSEKIHKKESSILSLIEEL